MNRDIMLGSAIQLIKDISRISFLGDRSACLKIEHMAKEWIETWIPKDSNQHNDES